MKVSKRLEGIEEYYFSQKLREIEQLRQSGKQIINLGIGNPDMAPSEDVIQTLQLHSNAHHAHGYQSYKGLPVLRKAIANFYAKWYNVNINADTEVLPLMGSKEGIMHICMTYLNDGEAALVPDPGYPTYSSAIKLAGGVPVYYHLNEENNWEPDFEVLSKLVTPNTKLFFVNYPHMPTGKAGSMELFEKIIAFAKQHHLLVCNDNPYSFILNEKPLSMLSISGAFSHVLELNSLSKSHNMAGWRMGMLIASAQHINDVLTFKSNMDSGMFLPLQHAAAVALSKDEQWFMQLNAIYKQRREYVYQMLDYIGSSYSKTQNGLFVWAKISTDYEDGYAMSDALLYQYNVFITPGGIFGENGKGYIRVSLCSTVEILQQALNQIKGFITK